MSSGIKAHQQVSHCAISMEINISIPGRNMTGSGTAEPWVKVTRGCFILQSSESNCDGWGSLFSTERCFLWSRSGWWAASWADVNGLTEAVKETVKYTTIKEQGWAARCIMGNCTSASALCLVFIFHMGRTTCGGWRHQIKENNNEKSTFKWSLMGQWCFGDSITSSAGFLSLAVQHSHLLVILWYCRNSSRGSVFNVQVSFKKTNTLSCHWKPLEIQILLMCTLLRPSLLTHTHQQFNKRDRVTVKCVSYQQ